MIIYDTDHETVPEQLVATKSADKPIENRQKAQT